MIKKIGAVIVLGAIVTFLALFVMFHSQENIKGHVFHISEQNPISMEDVSVHLSITDWHPGYRWWRVAFSNEYSTTTDKNGSFRLHVGDVPYEAHYRYSFIKEGYITKTIYRTYRSRDYPHMNIELTPAHDHERIEVVGELRTLYLGWGYKDQLFLFSLISVMISIPMIFMFFPLIWFADQFRKIRKSGFKGLSKTKQQAFLKDGFCESCKDYKGMTYEREESDLGMNFIYGPCDFCGTSVKVRIK